jgi:hypothetical protein
MYEPLNSVLKQFYEERDKEFLVVNTHRSKEFPADTSISLYDDGQLCHGLLYFIEWKHPSVSLDSPSDIRLLQHNSAYATAPDEIRLHSVQCRFLVDL